MTAEINPKTGRPYWETCARCNAGGHECPGCGTPVKHDDEVCQTCRDEVNRGER